MSGFGSGFSGSGKTPAGKPNFLQDYVAVNERVMQARKDYGSELSIVTDTTINEELRSSISVSVVYVAAKIIAKATTFCADIDKDKAVEKNETAAVGRTLTLAGYPAKEVSETILDDIANSVAKDERREVAQAAVKTVTTTAKPTTPKVGGFGTAVGPKTPTKAATPVAPAPKKPSPFEKFLAANKQK